MAGSLALLASIVGLLGLKETLPSAVRRNTSKTHAADQGTETEPLLSESTSVGAIESAEIPPLHALFVRPVLISLTTHGFLCFCQMSYEVLVPLVYATPIANGGLGLSPLYIGRIYGAVGLVNTFTQIFLSARLIRYFGPRTIYITAFCVLTLSFLAYPLLNYFARAAGHVDGRVIAVMVFQMSSAFVVFPTFACTQMFIVDSAPMPNSLGGVNGLAQMVASTCRSVAPTISASLFSLSVRHGLLGGNLVFFILAGMALCAVRAAQMLPSRLKTG
ncbi:Major facilitator superfamily multidrug-resistance DHA1 sub-family [Mycena indigotica]|uniref:Major facilitator superfamily multidrug-resistance DHA1 sub-family n=1 Tax=Mycena indigotica TaxID=2126181 RepID=A0A8H6S4J8_9AGAR|nr:Major facilitator superfamily multidrug-resistance DHA1 sub-family [Mycena indigotica]KAF7292633.1 Major facilitator superfamily multidrug-resistance DHA1 sub-family [Mycena indigotica]